MTVNYHIQGSSGKIADVTPQGALCTNPEVFSTSTRKVMDATSTAFNFKLPVVGQSFVITAIILNASQSVGTSAQVDVFEASSATSTTIDTAILTLDIPKGETIIINGVLLKIETGKFLNAVTDSTTVNTTILGHFIENNGNNSS